MTDRETFRSQAKPSERTRRLRQAALREQQLRSRGVDPWAGQRSAAQPGATHGRRPLPLKRIVLVVLLLAVVLVAGGALFAWQRVAAFNAAVSSAPSTSSSLWGPLGGSDRINVAMFGYGGDPKHGGQYLSDSIQIISIDPASNTTTLIPIPRDLWVEGDPLMPDNGKINEAFALGFAKGGVAEAGRAGVAVLQRVTGLTIHHWMAIDFAGFREMVNAVGGVTITNPRAFKFTWDEARFRAGTWDGGSYPAGTIHLNGDQALNYARARYTSVPAESSDFARSVRQQRIFSALRATVGKGGIGAIGPGLAMMDALQGRLKTDLSAIDLFLLSGRMNADRRIELKEGVILEATTNSIGQYVLVVIGRAGPTDYRPLKRFLATELARPIPSSSPTSSAVR
ncbi:MAG: hypothetical protein DLM71_08710 [Chloroflexi bacterium]|nr:MAG: hypothetical protein DLM71_08710 [Chloroflexota bacterium]